MDTGEEGEGGAQRGSSIDIYEPPCVRQLAIRKPLYSTGDSARRCVMT